MQKFSVIHSGVQHVLQTALAFYERDLLDILYSSYIIPKNKIKYFEKIHSTKLKKIISIRSAHEISENNIKNISRYEFIEIVLKVLSGKNIDSKCIYVSVNLFNQSLQHFSRTDFGKRCCTV